MKKTSLTLACLISFFSVSVSAQYSSKSWKAFFPAQELIVGKACAGTPANPICTGENASGADLVTSRSVTSLSQSQQKSLKIKFGEMFGINQNYLGSVAATNVKLDYVSSTYLDKFPRNVRFAYAALRAETVQINVTKDAATKANPQKIIEQLDLALRTAYPGVPFDKIKSFLPEDISDDRKSTYAITIKEPSVYFMYQLAELTIKDPRSLLGNENVLVFSRQTAGVCSAAAETFVLSPAEPETCSILVKVPNGSSKIRSIIRAREGKLYLVHNSANRNDSVEVEVKEVSPGRWQDTLGQPIYRYLYETSGDNIRWKEVYLFINATKTPEGISIIKKAGNKNFPTRISYPTLELKVID